MLSKADYQRNETPLYLSSTLTLFFWLAMLSPALLAVLWLFAAGTIVSNTERLWFGLSFFLKIFLSFISIPFLTYKSLTNNIAVTTIIPSKKQNTTDLIFLYQIVAICTADFPICSSPKSLRKLLLDLRNALRISTFTAIVILRHSLISKSSCASL